MTSDHVYIYSLEDDDAMKIIFYWQEKRFEFNRAKTEIVSKALHRISLRLQSKASKKKKKEQNTPVNIVFDIKLLKGSDSLDNLSNEVGFSNGSHLKVNENKYKVLVNPPTVSSFVLSDAMMAGFPTFPCMQIQFGDIENSKFFWYKGKSNCSVNDWELLAESFIYTPMNDDVSYYLKCVCTPGNKDFYFETLQEEVVSSVPVSANPGVCLFDKRHLYTPQYLDSSKEFRIVTYNILADLFADSDFARTFLYPYCPTYALNYKYRVQLLLKEILGYHGDIIGLQECEKKVFEQYLQPVLKLNGYTGILSMKPGQMPEGGALFFLNKTLEHVRDCTIAVTDALNLECNKDLLKQLKLCPLLCEKILKKTTIGQIHILRYVKECTQKYMCVLNTHLYYKPYAAQIRLIQIAAIMNYVGVVLESFNEEITFIALGDFNTLKGEPVLDYLEGVEITNKHKVWDIDEKFDPNAEIKRLNISLKNPIAVKNITGFPEFTNFVPYFQNTLDYVFAEDNKLEIIRFVPLPERVEIESYTALPSIVAPSDHLALVVDMKWK